MAVRGYSGSYIVRTNAKVLRRSLTLTERMVWSWLKNRKINGLKFRRQFLIGKYILDFYCSEKRIAIEIDGESHDMDEQIVHDVDRETFLLTKGISTLRLSNKEVLKSPEETEEYILYYCKTAPHSQRRDDFYRL